MVKAFSPTFTAEDLTKTPNHAAVAKVMMFDMPSTAFTMNLPAPMGNPNDELMDNLKLLSATKFAKTRTEVEKEINDRWNAANQEKAAEKAQAASNNAPTSQNNAPTSDVEAKDGFLDAWLSKTAK
jgi:hypothetical protein